MEIVKPAEARAQDDSRLPALRDVELADGTLQAGPDLSETTVEALNAQLAAVLGTDDPASGYRLFDDLARVVTPGCASPSASMRGALGLVREFQPRDGVEGMLAAQMVAVHTRAMNLLAPRAEVENLEVIAWRNNAALRLMRLFQLQLEGLERYRGKAPSQQKVVVEHVHVHEGGQAVVGNVGVGGGRG